MSDGTANCIDIILAIILPPLGVFFKFGCGVSKSEPPSPSPVVVQGSFIFLLAIRLQLARRRPAGRPPCMILCAGFILFVYDCCCYCV
jgi:hypothetical protein